MDRLIPAELIGKLKTLGDVLSANILGQDEVLSDIECLLRGSFCKLRFPEQPVASMLFLGANASSTLARIEEASTGLCCPEAGQYWTPNP